MRATPLVLLLALAQAVTGQEDPLLSRLDLRAKAGQVLMLWSLSRADGQASARARTLAAVRDLGIGGMVLSLGPVADAVAWGDELQAAAAIPLLLAGDFESGCGFRLSGATDLGKAMLLGASGSASLVEEAARATAREARALGFHWNFAPVLDVNVNPLNPIINVRSFGEDPAAVARLGIAYVRGLQAEGVLATAKHFPGHGDVASDSHLSMPTLSGDRARLDTVELLPFRAVANDVAAVMTGHLAVPGLGEADDVPATLSPRISTEVLRGELQFRGLIVTDALDMGGVKGKHDPGEVAVRALLAGADVLLMPPDAARARDAIVAAVESGRIPRARLDDAVARILRAKRNAKLFDAPARALPTWQAEISPAHRDLALAIARAGVTLVRDAAGLVPLPAGGQPTVLELFDSADAAAQEARLTLALQAAASVRLHPESSPRDVAAAADLLANAALPVVALHVRVREFSGRIGMPESFAPVVAALARTSRAVVVSFGNPYLMREFAAVSTYLCAYETTASTERAVADVLRGRGPVTGRLPVSIPDLAARGAGESRWPIGPAPLARAAPAQQGVAADLAERVRALLTTAIGARAFPGAVCLVARRGEVVAEVAAGHLTYASDAPPMTLSTRFDLASLTKVCATLPLALRLIAQGKLTLDTKVVALLPEFRGPGKDQVSIRHLLTHSAGLPAYVQFFKTLRGKVEIVRAACEEGLRTEAGADAVYSDLGMILLMACLDKVGGADFETLAAREVFAPLGMQATFAPTGKPIDAAPTEECAFRGRVVRGEVHDENAFAMGGVSGHAGLFGTADDVARLGLMFLGGGGGVLPPALARAATRRADVVAGSTRALGWDTFTPGGAGGNLLHATAFGHTGFTGTSIWCDPSRDLCVVLLTNRVHPTRVNAKIQRVRCDLHDLVVRALE